MRPFAFLVILTLCFASPGFADYTESYKEGYQAGYQFGKGSGELTAGKPSEPSVPVPDLRRYSNTAAYNRGFLDSQREAEG